MNGRSSLVGFPVLIQYRCMMLLDYTILMIGFMPSKLLALPKAVGTYVSARAFANGIRTANADSMRKICEATITFNHEARFSANRGDH